ISRHQYQLRVIGEHDAIERGEQSVNLAFASVQLFGNQQAVWCVVLAKWEGVDTALPLPIVATATKVALDTDSCLITLLCGLSEQLHDDRRHGRGDVLHALAGRCSMPRDMAVHPLHGIGRCEGERAREHLVEDDAQ